MCSHCQSLKNTSSSELLKKIGEDLKRTPKDKHLLDLVETIISNEVPFPEQNSSLNKLWQKENKS